MKKFLLASLAAATVMSASAFTINELTQKQGAVILFGNSFQLSIPVCVSGSSFSKSKDGRLVVNNFYDGLPVTMKQQGDKLIFEDWNGGYSPYYKNTIGSFTKCKNGMYTTTLDGTTVQLMCWEYDQSGNGLGDFNSTAYVNYDKNSGVPQQYVGMQGWAWGDASNLLLLEYYDVTNGTGNAQLMDIQGFNYWQMYTFDTNASCKEYYEGAVADMYGVDVTINGDKIYFKNFLNQGMRVQYDYDKNTSALGIVSGTIDYEAGTVTLPLQDMCYDVDWSFLGTAEGADCFLGDGQLFENGPVGYWFAYNGTEVFPWILVDGSTFTTDGKGNAHAAPLVGLITTGTAKHTGTNKWVSNDGDCKTSIENVISFDNAAIYGSYYDDLVGQCDHMEIVSSSELTADINLRISKSNYYNSNASAIGMLHTSANTTNVSHFDIYAVPGKYTSVKDVNFDHHAEKGHANAVLVHDGSQDADLEYGFSDEYALPEKLENTGNRDITYFVKTNYKPETGLEPTFHALTVYNATNAAEDLTSDVNALISVENGNIVIAGTDAPATVYTPAGAVVYNGTSRSIAVAAGIYMVKVADKVEKVVVK